MEIQGTKVFKRIFNRSDRIICLRGGTRSSKSFSMIQVVTLWLFTGQIGGRIVKKGTFSITRSTLPALKATVLKEFVNYLFELGVYKFVKHIRTTHEISYGGREVIFFSLDDSHKLRGRQHSFLWYNEVTDIDFETWNQGVFRTTHTIYNDYNPSGEPFIKTEIEDKRAKLPNSDTYVDVSVYTDNPFLPALMVKEIRDLKNVDNDLYLIYTKGIWVRLKGLIYPNIKIVDSIPLVGKAYLGVDFGYNDPSVFCRVVIHNDDLYIDTLVYKRGMLIDEMATKIKEHIKYSDLVYCDRAEPRTIEELKRRGINARAAKGGRDSVRQAITFIKQHNIYVTASSVDTIKEFKLYKWDQDSEGRLTDKPINYAKHSSDACSYAISKALAGRIKLL